MGQHRFIGADQQLHSFYNLKVKLILHFFSSFFVSLPSLFSVISLLIQRNEQVIFEPNRTGFEEVKHFNPPKGTIVAGRYEVSEFLGQVTTF